MTRYLGKKAKKPVVKAKAKKPVVKAKASSPGVAKVLTLLGKPRRGTAAASVKAPRTSETVRNTQPEVVPFERMTFAQQSKQILNTFAPADMRLVVGKSQSSDPFTEQFSSLKVKG